MRRARIVFLKAAANDADGIATSNSVGEVKRKIDLANRRKDRFISVQDANSPDRLRPQSVLVPVANIAYVEVCS